MCGVLEDQLLVLDIGKLTEPKELARYFLDGPYGLTADEKYVFVCDGYSGVRQLNVEDYANIYETGCIDDLDAYDIIKNNNILYISTFNGIFIYEITNETNHQFRAKIDD